MPDHEFIHILERTTLNMGMVIGFKKRKKIVIGGFMTLGFHHLHLFKPLCVFIIRLLDFIISCSSNYFS